MLMTAVPKSKRTQTPFILSHELKYGLKILSRNVQTHFVESVRCLFCAYHGREEIVGQKRKRQKTTNCKTWEVFRSDAYVKHHVQQHPTAWNLYDSADSDGKKHFFLEKMEHKNTLNAHLGNASTALNFSVDAAIVDDIILRAFFDQDEIDSSSHRRAMKLFHKTVDHESDGTYHYTCTVNKAMQFQLTTRFLAIGLSFRQVERAVDATREVANVAKVGALNEMLVGDYARILVGVGLQMITNILSRNETWAFSLANNSSTHFNLSYFEQRICVHVDGDIYNLHLISMPMFERHTSENMAFLVFKILDVVCTSWRGKLLSVSTDGANTMTGRHNGVVTRIQREATAPLYRIWCLIHQIDLVSKRNLLALFDGNFHNIINKVAACLRKQQKLIDDMGATCPKMTTRWLALGVWTKWQLDHRIDIETWFASRTAPGQVKLPHWWWPIVAVVCAVMTQLNVAIVKLQSKNLLLSHQIAEIERVVSIICNKCDVEVMDPLIEVDAATDGLQSVTCGKYSVTYHNVETFLLDQGSFIKRALDAMAVSQRVEVFHEMGTFIVAMINGIVQLVASRDANNLPSEEEIPPVLPHQLVAVRPAAFAALANKHGGRLAQLGQNLIDHVEQDHRDIIAAFDNEPSLNEALHRCNNDTSSREGWAAVEGRFRGLRDFCGGIATIFPNTSSVESSFSILGWEKDANRLSLTDLALEGCMQARQFDLLSKLA